MNTEQGAPVLLLIDTSTSVCSVAIAQGEALLAHRCERDAQGRHAALAAPMVQAMLAELGQRGLRLDAVALSEGPGSYTGLRIGSSLAKGLCHGYGLPLIAVSTLAMMADGYTSLLESVPTDAVIVPMIDARRMEVYTASFDRAGQRLQEDHPLVLVEGEPSWDVQAHPHYFVGDGAHKVDGLWLEAKYTVSADFVPEARYMLPRALAAYRAGQFVDLAYWTPSYLKDYIPTIGRNKVLGA